MRRLKLFLIMFFMLQMAWSIFLWNRLNQPTEQFELWGSLLVAGILGLLALISVVFRILMIIANTAYFALILFSFYFIETSSLISFNTIGAAFILNFKIMLYVILFISTFAINAIVGILLQLNLKSS